MKKAKGSKVQKKNTAEKKPVQKPLAKVKNETRGPTISLIFRTRRSHRAQLSELRKWCQSPRHGGA